MYLKFKHFLIINNFLFIKSLIKEGWQNRETGKKSDPRIQFNSFKLLHDVLDSFAKKLSIQLNLNEIDKALEIGAAKATNIANDVLSRVRLKLGY